MILSRKEGSSPGVYKGGKKMQKTEFFRDDSLMCSEWKNIKSLAIPVVQNMWGNEKSKMAAFSQIRSKVNMLTYNIVV